MIHSSRNYVDRRSCCAVRRSCNARWRRSVRARRSSGCQRRGAGGSPGTPPSRRNGATPRPYQPCGARRHLTSSQTTGRPGNRPGNTGAILPISLIFLLSRVWMKYVQYKTKNPRLSRVLGVKKVPRARVKPFRIFFHRVSALKVHVLQLLFNKR